MSRRPQEQRREARGIARTAKIFHEKRVKLGPSALRVKEAEHLGQPHCRSAQLHGDGPAVVLLSDLMRGEARNHSGDRDFFHGA